MCDRNDDMPLAQLLGLSLVILVLMEVYDRVQHWTTGWIWLGQWAVWAVAGALVFLPMSAVIACLDAKRSTTEPALSYVVRAFAAGSVLGTFMFVLHNARLLPLWAWLGLVLGAAVVGGYLTSRQGNGGTT